LVWFGWSGIRVAGYLIIEEKFIQYSTLTVL